MPSNVVEHTVTDALEPVLSDARQLIKLVVQKQYIDEYLDEVSSLRPHTADILARLARSTFDADLTMRERNSRVQSLKLSTTYGRACVEAIRSGDLAHHTTEGRYTGSRLVGCVQAEPNFAQASQSEHSIGLVLALDGKPIAMQKKSGAENSAIAFEDFEVETMLNGRVFVPKSSLFSIGKSMVNGDMRVVNVDEAILDKAAIMRATTFSLPQGSHVAFESAPWFGMSRNADGLAEIQQRVQNLIA